MKAPKIINVSTANVRTDLAIPRGDHVPLLFRNTPAGALPGSTIKFTVSRNPDSATKIIGPKACSTPDSEGAFTVTLTSAETNQTAGQYFWDCRIVDPGGETLLGSGLFVISGIAQLP